MDITEREPFPFITKEDSEHLVPNSQAAAYHHAGNPGDDSAQMEAGGVQLQESIGTPSLAAAVETGSPPLPAESGDSSAMPSSAAAPRAGDFGYGRYHASAGEEKKDKDSSGTGSYRRRTRFAALGILGSALAAGCILILSPWSGAKTEFHDRTPGTAYSAAPSPQNAKRIGAMERQLQQILEKMAQMEKHWPQSVSSPGENNALLQTVGQLQEESKARIAGFSTQLKDMHERTMILDEMGQRIQRLEQHAKQATAEQEAATRPDFLAVTIKQLGGRSYVTVLDAQGRRRVLHPDDMLNGWRLVTADFQKRAAIFESDDGHRYTSTL